MAYHSCAVCNIERPVTTRSWTQAQVISIDRFGTAVVGPYNACRFCSRDGWVDPPTPDGELHPYACTVCLVIRPHSRRYWTPSQLKSICSSGTSVTAHHNCCRVCDPSCWIAYSGAEVTMLQDDRSPADPTPTMLGESPTIHREQQGRVESPPSLSVIPPHEVQVSVSSSAWRPPSSLERPLTSRRPRWLEQYAIKNDILCIQNEVPTGVWE